VFYSDQSVYKYCVLIIIINLMVILVQFSSFQIYIKQWNHKGKTIHSEAREVIRRVILACDEVSRQGKLTHTVK
jgi:hypothetical protein